VPHFLASTSQRLCQSPPDPMHPTTCAAFAHRIADTPQRVPLEYVTRLKVWMEHDGSSSDDIAAQLLKLAPLTEAVAQ
jgi:hypothetical protein